MVSSHTNNCRLSKDNCTFRDKVSVFVYFTTKYNYQNRSSTIYTGKTKFTCIVWYGISSDASMHGWCQQTFWPLTPSPALDGSPFCPFEPEKPGSPSGPWGPGSPGNPGSPCNVTMFRLQTELPLTLQLLLLTTVGTSCRLCHVLLQEIHNIFDVLS